MSTDDDARPDEALLRTALTLAAYGWHVFPCVPGGKRPALRGNWQDLATSDPALIRRWWSILPYNVGIACGPSGLIVLDLDVPGHGQGRPRDVPAQPSGAGTLVSLSRRHGQPVPAETFTVRTPSGGHHLYFTASGTSVRNSAGRLGPLIDVRAAGGYVIAPGSRIDGNHYAITSRTPPAPFPSWIATLLRKPDQPTPNARYRAAQLEDGDAYAMAALRDEARLVATAAEHTRNDTLNRAAFNLGQLVGAGLLPSQAVSTALTEAAAQAGLPARETSRTIRSGMTAGACVPRQMPRRARAPEFRAPEREAPGHMPRM